MQYPPPPSAPGQPPTAAGGGYGYRDSGYGAPPPAPPPPPWAGAQQYPGHPVAGAMPGNQGSQLPPAPIAGAGKRAASGLAVFVLVAGLLAAALSAFLFLRGAADSVAKLVPDDASVYSTYYLDPPGAQKPNLNRLIAKFPAFKGSAGTSTNPLNDALDSALHGLGMDHNDVLPWLGAQAGFSLAGSAYGTGKTPAYAVYITTRNDGQTQSALTKLQGSSAGKLFTYSTESHDGVTITDVTGGGQSGGISTLAAFSYAIVDHNLVVAANSSYMNAIIDTDHGKRAGIESTGDYKALQNRLPHDRLFMLYVDFPSLVKALAATATISPAAPATAGQPTFAEAFKAYRGMGFTASAAPDGFAIDAVTDFDTSQLNDAARQALGIPPHINGTTRATPAAALGFLGLTGIQYLLRSVADAARKASPEVGRILDSIGFAGAVSHFTGDSGIEVGLRNGGTPTGAWIVATDDAASTRAFLDKAIPTLMASGGSAVGVAPTPTSPPPPVTHEAYKGVDISEAGGAAGGPVSWTVTKGVAIVANDPAEVKAIIDVASGGASLADSPAYRSALGGGVTNNGSAYVDVQGIIGVLERTLSPSEKQIFDRDVLPNLRPIQAIVITETSAADHTSGHLLIKIP